MKKIISGNVYQVSPWVRRITAPNPSVMTGPGTNTYIIGKQQFAVVDPGPADTSHINAILNACGGEGSGQLKWILVTHTHRDHSPAAKRLAELTGAQLLGNVLPEDDGFQDKSFTPSHQFQHDEVFNTGEVNVRVIHTPGHVDNHLCFFIEEDGLVLTGDHIMQGSTVVIIPPHGDMSAYIHSLRALLDYPLRYLGPGHGTIIDEPRVEVERLIRHRLGREDKVVSVLIEVKEGSLKSLTPRVYDDVDSGLHGIAKYSLWAHLLKLEKEGVVTVDGELWRHIGL